MEPCYLIHGTDDFLIQEAARKLVNQLVPPAEQDTGLVIVDGAQDRVDDIEQAIKAVIQGLFTVSLFGDRTVVWLRDACFLNPNRDPGRSASVKEQVAGLVEKLKAGSPGNSLVISGGPLDKRSALYKYFLATGEIQTFLLPEKSWEADKAAAAKAKDGFREANLQISPDLMQRFIQRTGPDTRQVHMEIDKLALFTGPGGTVTAEMIEELVTPAREAVLWDFTDAVARAQLERSIALLRQLFTQKENAVGIVIQLVNRFRELLLIKECQQRGWLKGQQWSNHPEAAGVLGQLGKGDPRKLHQFRLKNLVGQAGSFQLKALRESRDLLVKAHENMVSSRLPSEWMLEWAVVQVIARAKR